MIILTCENTRIDSRTRRICMLIQNLLIAKPIGFIVTDIFQSYRIIPSIQRLFQFVDDRKLYSDKAY